MTESFLSPTQQQILCVCCSEYNEWDRENVVMTGSADGVVRMWSIDYVEVPVGGEGDKEREDQASCKGFLGLSDELMV